MNLVTEICGELIYYLFNLNGKENKVETYIQVSFWLGVFALAVNLISILMYEKPKVKTETIGELLFRFIVGAGFTIWSGFILFS